MLSDRADAAAQAVLAARALIVRHTIAEADQAIAQVEQLLGATEH